MKTTISSTELSQCLTWFGLHYKLKGFHDKETELYDNALEEYGFSLSTNSVASREMVKAIKRLVQAATKLVSRSDKIVSVPEAASATHYAWRTFFSRHLTWATAQCAYYEAISDGMIPRREYVVKLILETTDSWNEAENEEKKLLKQMGNSGLTPSDTLKLVRASGAIANDNRQPLED